MLDSHIHAPLTVPFQLVNSDLCLITPKMIEISTFKIEFSAICFSTEHEDSVWSGSSGNNLTLCP